MPELKPEVLKVLRMAGEKFLSNREFRAQFKEAKVYAVDKFKDSLPMQFWLYGVPTSRAKDQKKCIMPVIMGNWEPKDDAEKQTIVRGIGMKFKEQFPDHMLTTVVHMSEAWMVQRDKDQPKEDDYTAPSKSPNKIEVILIDALTMDRRRSFYTGQIKRDWKGDVVNIETKIEEVYDGRKKSGFQDIQGHLAEGIFMGAYVDAFTKEEKNGKTK